MSAQFGLFLGDDRIPVINWINRHGSPEGRELRFTLPTEAKAKVEANLSKTFRLERGGQKWDFEIVRITQHCTGTNGLPAVGRVKQGAAAAAKPKKAFGDRPKSGLSIPKPEGSEASLEKREPTGLKAALLKNKEKLKAKLAAASEASDDDPATQTGLPSSDSEATDSATEKGHPAVDPGKKGEEE